jgi:hypothetical protein
MMKKPYLILFAIINSLYLNAQETENTSNDLRKFGIGLYAHQFELTNVQSSGNLITTPKLLLSYNIQKYLRLETNFGLQTLKRDDYKSNGYHLGLNCLGMFQKEKVNFIYGIMVGYDNQKIEETRTSYNGDLEYDIENKRISLGPKIGAEYLLSRYFSVGGEIGLVYYNENYKQTGGNRYYEDNEDYKTTSWFLDSGLFVKFYF